MPLPIFQDKIQDGLQEVSSIIGIAAGKGGVGKSTVSVCLALSLRRLGYRVGLLDCDLYGPSIRKMLPEDELPKEKEGAILPGVASGISVLSLAHFRKEGEANAVRAPIANGIIQQFIHQVKWGKLDYLLIDFPPGTGDIQLTLAQKAEITGAIMVTTPQDVSLIDVRKAINLFEQVKVPIVGVVENMSYYLHPSTQEIVQLFGQGGGKKLAREAGLPFLGQIPFDPKLCSLLDRGINPFEENLIENSLISSFQTVLEEALIQIETLKDISREALHNFELIWQQIPK